MWDSSLRGFKENAARPGVSPKLIDENTFVSCMRSSPSFHGCSKEQPGIKKL